MGLIWFNFGRLGDFAFLIVFGEAGCFLELKLKLLFVTAVLL